MNEMQAQLRERLAAASVRELVEVDMASEDERIMLYGRCQICSDVPTTYRKFGIDDRDHLHAEVGMICMGCGRA